MDRTLTTSSEGSSGSNWVPPEGVESSPSNPAMNMRQQLTSHSQNMDRTLLSALRAGDKDQLQKQRQDDSNYYYRKTVKGNSILHIAASNEYNCLMSYEDILPDDLPDDLLLRQNERGDTVLHCAARVGRVPFIDYLYRRYNRQLIMSMMAVLNDRGDTALHEAARGGHVNAVQKLVGAGPNMGPNMAAVVNRDGESPLYLAAVRGSVEAVQTLLACPVVKYGGPTTRGVEQLVAAQAWYPQVPGSILSARSRERAQTGWV